MPSVDTVQNPRPFHRRHKNAILLTALLLLILFSPLNQLFEWEEMLNMVLATAVMAAALNAVSYRKRSTFFWALSLVALAGIFGWMQAFAQSASHQSHAAYLILANISGAALYIYIATLLFRVILTDDEITVDQVFAGVVIYIFIGLAWAHFYGLSEIFQNDSISGTNGSNGSDTSFVYFSFVTLTTLGYGDMRPVTAMSKALVIVEAIIGVMFVAILVATLVGRVNRKR